MKEVNHDLIIIGGGPAGLSAAIAAREAGVDDVLIIERDHALGGILNQCIHNGFGLHTFKEELTGPEYADRYISRVKALGIPYMEDTTVLKITKDKTIVTTGKKTEFKKIQAKAIILAMGCRERPRGALDIPGTRPAGIYTAGTAQRLVNIEGKCVGHDVVILGSGDIGLIMARRLTLEGSHVHTVAEVMPYSGGLKRNIVQCLEDFGIPLELSTTVIDIEGKERLKSVTLAKVDENRRPISGTERRVACDTLLLSCGLIPENELTYSMGVLMNPVTGGAIVNDQMETTVPGVFACGNVLHVHDLVDYVSEESALAGRSAAAFLAGSQRDGTASIALEAGPGIRYLVPQSIKIENYNPQITVRFRVSDVYKNRSICVYFDEDCVRRIPKRVMAPGEMQQVILSRDQLKKATPSKILIRTEE